MAQLILIVEDNPDNSILMEKILEWAKYEVKVVTTGQEALDFCANEAPALILLDLALPDINGLELAKRLREKDAKTPIIAVTAHDVPGMEEETDKAGFTAYLAKPFQPEELVALISKYLPQ